MLQGEAIGARAIGDVRPDAAAPGWLTGIRPGQSGRVPPRMEAMQPVRFKGRRIR